MYDLFSAEPEAQPQEQHLIHFDGSCVPNPGRMGIGYTIHDPQGKLIAERSDSAGQGTNNIAEYLGLIAALRAALAMNIQHVAVRGDSLNVVTAMQGKGAPIHKRHPNIQPLLREAIQLSRQFQTFQIGHIRRELNSHADGLSALPNGARFHVHALPSMRPSCQPSCANRAHHPTPCAAAQ